MNICAAYCVDTSSLIEAWVRFYPPDIFARLWTGFEDLIQTGRFRSPIEVRMELERKEDDLCKWAKKQTGLFVPLDILQTREVSLIMNEFPRLVDTSSGRSGGDPFVIALAKVYGHTVVTQEVGSLKKPKIPDVCRHYSVPCITILDLIRAEKWRF